MESIHKFCESTWIGYGKSTYSLVTNKKENGGNYTNIAPNILSQILIEQGVIGLILMIFLSVEIIIYAIRNKHNHNTIIATITLIMLSAKEMTHATMSSALGIQIIAVIILSALQRVQSPRKNQKPTRYNNLNIIIGMTIVAIGLIFKFMSVNLADVRPKYLIENAISAISRHNYKQAIESLELIDRKYYQYDMYLCRLLIALYLKDDRYECARLLATRLPDTTGIDYWLKGIINIYDNKDSIIMCSQALYKEPRIALTADFINFKFLHSALNDTIIRDVAQCKLEMTAYEEAQYGALLHYMRMGNRAIPHLKNSIKQYPTLRTPYLLLGDTIVYEFLRQGIFYNSTIDVCYPEPYNLIDLILSYYKYPLSDWYSIELSKNYELP